MLKRSIAMLLAVSVLGQGVFLVGGAGAQVTEQVVQINRFEVAPNNKIEPGTRLKFTVKGTPRVQAFLTVPGETDPLPMKEVKPGIYQRDYVIKKDSDQLDRFTNAKAELKKGPNTTLATLKLGERAVTPGQGQR